MRTFIAIELAKDIKEELRILIETLSRSGADVKWVEVENLHMTIRFLGDVDTNKITQIKKILDDVNKRQRAFLLSLSCVGCFPDIRYPRVIWVGIDKGKEEIKMLTNELEPKLEEIGFLPEERPFHPHLTVGRVRTSKERHNLQEALQKTTFSSSEPVIIDRVILFSSQLTPKGPIYTSLHISKFLKGPTLWRL